MFFGLIMSKVNISVDDINNQLESMSAPRKEFVFDEKLYLNTTLKSNEFSKTVTVRLLPFSPEGGSPFYEIKTHMIKVHQDLSTSPWGKQYVCLKNNADLDNSIPRKCPICEMHDKAQELIKTAKTEAELTKYSDLEKSTRIKRTWIVRCIDRDHEDEGVKFWRFNYNYQKDGVFDKIMAIYKSRYEKYGINIFDLYEGRDLEINITKDDKGKRAYHIVDTPVATPLASTDEQILAWVNDPKKWTDAYAIKPYEYLQIALIGGVPTYDKDARCWVDKVELDKVDAEKKALEEAEGERLRQEEMANEAAIDTMTSVISNNPTAEEEEDDLPF